MGDSPYQLNDTPYSSHWVILSILGEGRGRRLLDVGAADGFLAEILTARGFVVTAVEREPDRAERARGRCQDVIVGDLADVASTLSGPFDAIVYGDVLEHLLDPLGALRLAPRILVPGGLVVASVPNIAHLWIRLSLLLGRFDYAERGILDRTHLSFFTRRTFLAMLARAGFVVDELHVTPAPLPLVVPPHLHGAWLRAMQALSARASRVWPGGLAYQFVAACRLPSPGPLPSVARGAARVARPAGV